MLRPGTKAIAFYSYYPTEQVALQMTRGENLIIVASIPADPNWVQVRNCHGKEGIVPTSYLEIVQTMGEWFHGQISREATEQLLSNQPNGKYLVRSSLKFRGDYTLSVKFNENIEHYHIFKKDRGYSIDDEEFFHTLDDLLAHYTKMADGLCTNLKGHVPKDNLKNYSIDFKQIKMEEKIGQGEFGDVMRGMWKNKEVAVKCFKNTNDSEKSVFAFEASLMVQLEHPNLVSFVGVSYQNNQVYLITEYMQNGSLVSYLRTRGKSMITKNELLGFAIGACKGMNYLESQNLIHRDLAARNILLDRTLVAKVADFGLARRADTEQSSKNPQPGKIPVKWTAPEAFKFNKFSSKSDVWSYGILLWEIYSYGRMPYPKLLATHVIEYLESGNRMESPEDCPPKIYDLMKMTWSMDPSARPSFKDILIELNNEEAVSKNS